jgi:hypothetical protein
VAISRGVLAELIKFDKGFHKAFDGTCGQNFIFCSKIPKILGEATLLGY